MLTGECYSGEYEISVVFAASKARQNSPTGKIRKSASGVQIDPANTDGLCRLAREKAEVSPRQLPEVVLQLPCGKFVVFAEDSSSCRVEV